MFDSSTIRTKDKMGNIGKYLTNVAGALTKEDNRTHRIALAKNLVENNGIECFCREERQRNKNVLCTRQVEGNGKGSGVSHRNGNKPKVSLDQSSILVTISGKDAAFV